MKNKQNTKQTIFLFCIFLAQLRAFCSKVVFISPYIPAIEKVLFIALAVLSLYNFVVSRFRIKEFILVIFLLILSVASYVVTDSLVLPYLMLLPFAARGAELKRIIKTDLLSKAIITVFVIACHSADLTSERMIYRDGVFRESFGFAHPNTLGYICIVLCLDALYLLKIRTDSIMARIIVGAIPLLLATLADSRTAQLAIIISIAFSVLETKCKFFKKHNNRKKEYRNLLKKAARGLLYTLPVLLILFSFYSTHAYSRREEWALKADEALSTRIYLQDYYEKHYEVSLLGQRFTWDDKQKALDNGYYRILFNNGVLGLVTLVVIIEVSLTRSIKKKSGLVPTLVLLLIYGLSEWTVFRVIMTPFWCVAFAKIEELPEAKDEKKKIAE